MEVIKSELSFKHGWTLDKQEEQREYVVKGCGSKGRDGKEQGLSGDQAVDQFVMSWRGGGVGRLRRE